MKFKKTSTVACALALVMVVGATTAFAASANTTAEPEHKDTSSIAIAGVPDNKSDRVSIDLNSAGDNSDYEMQVLGDSAVSNSTTINMEDAESEDSANLPGVEVSDGLALISVSHDDESKFTPEEWAKILQQIEQGTVYWED